MEKKIVAYFTMVSFVFFAFSCYTIKKISPASGKENQKVYALKTKAGEYIKFKEINPVVIQQGSIKLTREVKVEQVIEIEIKNIKKMFGNSQSEIVAIETNDGKLYTVREMFFKDSVKMKLKALLVSEEIIIPIADIQNLWVKGINWGGTIFGIAIPIVLIVFLADLLKKDPTPPPTPHPPPGQYRWGG